MSTRFQSSHLPHPFSSVSSSAKGSVNVVEPRYRSLESVKGLLPRREESSGSGRRIAVKVSLHTRAFYAISTLRVSEKWERPREMQILAPAEQFRDYSTYRMGRGVVGSWGSRSALRLVINRGC